MLGHWNLLNNIITELLKHRQAIIMIVSFNKLKTLKQNNNAMGQPILKHTLKIRNNRIKSLIYYTSSLAYVYTTSYTPEMLIIDHTEETSVYMYLNLPYKSLKPNQINTTARCGQLCSPWLHIMMPELLTRWQTTTAMVTLVSVATLRQD